MKIFDRWDSVNQVLLDPPDGWDMPGYDDSAWPSSASIGFSDAIISTLPNGAPDYAFTAGTAEPVGPFTGVAPNAPFGTNIAWLNRWYFDTPVGGYLYYTNMDTTSDFFVSGGTLNGVLNLPFNYPIQPTVPEIQAALNGPGDSNLMAFGSRWVVGEPPQNPLYAHVQFWFYIPDAGGFPVAWGTIEAGVNDRGVLGTGTNETIVVPTYMDTRSFPDPADPRVVKISSNGKTTLLLDAYGNVYGCGDNEFGMAQPAVTFPLHSGDTDVHASPELIALPEAAEDIVDIAVGGDSCIVLTRRGGAFLWGQNAYGSVGVGNTSPVYAPIGSRIGGGMSVGAGARHTLSASNRIVAAGDNTYGQLGDGSTTSSTVFVDTDAPVLFFPDYYETLSGGEDGTLAMASTGDVYAFGRAEFGGLGFEAYSAGTGPNKIVSTPVSAFTGLAPFGAQQLGPMGAAVSYGQTGRLDLGPNVFMAGDGTPYGGAGDGVGTQVYGTDISFETNGVLTGAITGLSNVVALATTGGLTNQRVGSDDSRATYAAISRVYELEMTADVLTGITLSQEAGLQFTYLWPFGDDAAMPLPLFTRKVEFSVTNVAGSGAGVTVGLNLSIYSDQFTQANSNSVNCPVGQTRTLTFDNLTLAGNAFGVSEPYGIQANVLYSAGPPRTNTVTATLKLYTVTGFDDVLYTWGYGGYGQMGNGGMVATNLFAISQNGLGQVSQVCVARRVMFAVAVTGAVVAPTVGRSYAMVIG